MDRLLIEAALCRCDSLIVSKPWSDQHGIIWLLSRYHLTISALRALSCIAYIAWEPILTDTKIHISVSAKRTRAT